MQTPDNPSPIRDQKIAPEICQNSILQHLGSVPGRCFGACIWLCVSLYCFFICSTACWHSLVPSWRFLVELSPPAMAASMSVVNVSFSWSVSFSSAILSITRTSPSRSRGLPSCHLNELKRKEKIYCQKNNLLFEDQTYILRHYEKNLTRTDTNITLGLNFKTMEYTWVRFTEQSHNAIGFIMFRKSS